MGLNRSAIGTAVERTSRFTVLLHLPRKIGYGTIPPVKNGPALSGYGSEAVRDALTTALLPLPEHLRRSLTWDRGKEIARHADLTAATGISVYFCDPYSPWQRGTNENANGLLRQYFPKGTDLSRYDRHEVDAVADAVNNRPRKELKWLRPRKSLLNKYTHSHWTVLRRSVESAAAFFRNSFSIRSLRISDSISATRAASTGFVVVAGSGFSSRDALTHLPSVPGLISRSRATAASERPSPTTICTASALNCGLN